MSRWQLAWVAAIVAVGCHADHVDQAETDRACTTVVGDALVRVSRSARHEPTGSAAPATAAAPDPIDQATIRACREDHWPSDVIACHATATSVAAIGLCQAKLSKEDVQHLAQLTIDAIDGKP